MSAGRRIELSAQDILVYEGKEVDWDILKAIFDTDRRLLWAFITNAYGDLQAVPYTEQEVIWMAESDVLREQDVEI